MSEANKPLLLKDEIDIYKQPYIITQPIQQYALPIDNVNDPQVQPDALLANNDKYPNMNPIDGGKKRKSKRKSNKKSKRKSNAKSKRKSNTKSKRK